MLVEIKQIRLNENGILKISPDTTGHWASFEFIYRDASFVRWDDTTSELLSVHPDAKLDALNSFVRICHAVNNEYGVRLHVTDNTSFMNLPDTLIDAIRDAG